MTRHFARIFLRAFSAVRSQFWVFQAFHRHYSIGKKEKATQGYLDTELVPSINLWKYLVRSPYAYRKSIRRRKQHYGSKGPLQYIIDKYSKPEIGANALDTVRKYGPDYVCKI